MSHRSSSSECEGLTLGDCSELVTRPKGHGGAGERRRCPGGLASTLLAAASPGRSSDRPLEVTPTAPWLRRPDPNTKGEWEVGG